MTHDEAAIFYAIGHDPVHIDDIFNATGLEDSALYLALYDLQDKGFIEELQGRLFRRKPEQTRKIGKVKTYEELEAENKIFRAVILQVYDQMQFALDHNHAIYHGGDGKSRVYFMLYLEELRESFEQLTNLNQ